MKKMFLLAAALFAALMSHADTETIDGITLKYFIFKDQASITEAIGPAESLTIPSELGGKPVRYIGEGWLGRRLSRHSVFSGCTNLTSVTIPGSVTSIKEDVFTRCRALTSVTISEGVASIGGCAFKDCVNLASVTIPSSVTEIGSRAFSNTPFYRNQPDGLLVFGKVAYEFKGDCPTEVTIPEGVTSISDLAFYGCTNLTSVTIPEGVTSIRGHAFCGCRGLTSVTIPGSVTSIWNGVFRDCTGLTSVTIPSSVTSICEQTFYGCTNLTSVTIPSSVMSIGNSAFSKCTNLTSVTIPEGVKKIGLRAFSDCPNLKMFNVIENGEYKSVPVEEFLDKHSIFRHRKETSPTTTEIIGDTVWQYRIFDDLATIIKVSGPAESLMIPSELGGKRVVNIAAYTFVGRAVPLMDGAVFSGCTNLTSVTIPSSVTNIGWNAFYNCHKLASVTIPKSVTRVGEHAFYGCSALTSVTIPSSVMSIGNSAFSKCTNLTSVTIPEGVKKIGLRAFSDCPNLKMFNVIENGEYKSVPAEEFLKKWSSGFNGSRGAPGVFRRQSWAAAEGESKKDAADALAKKKAEMSAPKKTLRNALEQRKKDQEAAESDAHDL